MPIATLRSVPALHLHERLVDEQGRVGGKVRAGVGGEVRAGIGVELEVRVRIKRVRVGLGLTLSTSRC